MTSASTVDVTLTVDGVSATVRSDADTVAELLFAERVPIAPTMTVEPSPDTHVYDGLSVAINYSQPSTNPPKYVTLSVDGATHHFNTSANTVEALLLERGLTLGAADRLNATLAARVRDGMRLRLQRVVTQEETQEEEIAFSTNRSYTADLAPGETRVLAAGVPGIRTIKSQVTYVDGVEESRTVLLDEITSEPVLEKLEIGVGSVGVVSAGSAQEVAHRLVSERGWDDNEFQCLVNLWQRESNWRVTAENEWSGAYGIPQALPGDKMAAFGDDWRTNAETQIKWGLHYIANRYATPCGAWDFFLAKNWY
ncbi:MAG: G5 domain-containing protein [Propionibacteriaceae bacterium]|nr:G5 domain-containing protein [Propionibacteriaceae bacterium]